MNISLPDFLCRIGLIFCCFSSHYTWLRCLITICYLLVSAWLRSELVTPEPVIRLMRRSEPVVTIDWAGLGWPACSSWADSGLAPSCSGILTLYTSQPLSIVNTSKHHLYHHHRHHALGSPSHLLSSAQFVTPHEPAPPVFLAKAWQGCRPELGRGQAEPFLLSWSWKWWVQSPPRTWTVTDRLIQDN